MFLCTCFQFAYRKKTKKNKWSWSGKSQTNQLLNIPIPQYTQFIFSFSIDLLLKYELCLDRYPRWQYIQYNNGQSSFITRNTRVLQGCTLSPLLFVLYINDYNRTQDRNRIIRFADDAALVENNYYQLNLPFHSGVKANFDFKHQKDHRLHIQETVLQYTNKLSICTTLHLWWRKLLLIHLSPFTLNVPSCPQAATTSFCCWKQEELSYHLFLPVTTC